MEWLDDILIYFSKYELRVFGSTNTKGLREAVNEKRGECCLVKGVTEYQEVLKAFRNYLEF